MTDTTTEAETEDATEQAFEGSDAGTLEVLPPARLPDMAAITTLREHVGAMRDAKFFAEGMCYTALVPDRFRGKPGDGAAAILYGAEIGLSPIASLRSVIVIHGQPGLEARTMKAILKAKGYVFRQIERSATRAEIWAWEPDSPKVYDDQGQRINPDETAVWTIEDAIQAEFVPTKDERGEWKKNSNNKLLGNMKYITTPKVMLNAKVTAEVCREIAPHILLGMPYASDELETEDWATVDSDRPDRPAPAQRPGGRGVDGLRARAQAAAQQRHGEVIDAETDDYDGEATANAAEAAEANPVTQEEAPSGVGDTEDVDTPVEPVGTTTADPGQGSDLRKSVRKKNNDTCFAIFNKVKLTGDENREDRLVVIRGVLDEPSIQSTKDLSDDQLQELRNRLVARDKAGTLDADVTDWINRDVLRREGIDPDATPTDPAAQPGDGK